MTTSPHISGVPYDAELPTVNRAHLDGILGPESAQQSQQLVQHIYELFLSESREKLDGLNAACQADDLATLRAIVHFLAGGSGSLGMVRLSTYLQAIERAIAAEQLTDLSNCSASILLEFERSCAEFKRIYTLS